MEQDGGLALAGLLGPWYFNIAYVTGGGDPTDIAGALVLAFANPVSASLSVDLLIAFAVFAVWAARRNVDQDQVGAIHRGLLESRDWGLKNLDVLAADASAVTGFEADMCEDYLSGLDYALSPKHIAGLTNFFSRLEANRSIPAGSLKFLSVA